MTRNNLIGEAIDVDVSQALLNGRRVAELGDSAKLRLTLVRTNTARVARGYARFEPRTLRVLNPGAGVAQLVFRYA